jgi:MFS family permease
LAVDLSSRPATVTSTRLARVSSVLPRRLATPASTYYAMRLATQAGQGVFLAAILLIAATGGSAALSVSGVMVAMMAGAIVFGIPAGALADRISPRIALPIGAAGRMLAILGTLFAIGRPELLIPVAFAYSVLSQLFSASELALAANVGANRPGRTHAWLLALQHAGQGAGLFLVAPAAFALGGVTAMVLVSFAVYVAGTALTLALAVSLRGTDRTQPRRRSGVRDTLRYYRDERRATYAGSLIAFNEVATKAMLVAVPLYLDELGLMRIQIAALVIPAAAGALIGMAWAGRSLHVQVAPGVMRLTLLGLAVSLFALAGLGNALAGLAGIHQDNWFSFLAHPQNLSFAVAFPVALLLGMCWVIAPIGARTVLTATAPPGQQARVFALQGTLTDVLAILPLMAAGFASEFAGPRVTFVMLALLGTALFAAMEARTSGAGLLPLKPTVPARSDP